MQHHVAMKNFIIYSLLFTFIFLPALPGHAEDLTQRDWMISLVDATGWAYGLPDEPQDPDYINILTGNREFRFEAEDIYDKSRDNVSTLAFQNFGDFSGQGWLHGTKDPTTIHLQFTLPISGEYELQAHLRQAGHVFALAGKSTLADAKSAFTKVIVGSYSLQAGSQEIIVTLPPNGAIDYISLSASNKASIIPDGGWQPDKLLSWDVLQTTLLQLWKLADLFPLSPTSLTIEAESLKQSAAKVVTSQHLGSTSGGKWLRNGPIPAEVRFPISLSKSGFYDVTLRVMGSPINISIGDHQNLQLDAKPYLEDITLQPLFLFAGNSHITFELPSGGGIDLLSLTERKIDTDQANTLLDLKQTDRPEAQDLDSIISLLAAFGVER